MEAKKLTIQKDTVLCRANDKNYDLYYVLKGKLLVCNRNGHMVTPIAYLEANQYFGEMSFIDKLPRSADVIAIEETQFLKIPSQMLQNKFTRWLHIMAKRITKKMRVINNTGCRK